MVRQDARDQDTGDTHPQRGGKQARPDQRVRLQSESLEETHRLGALLGRVLDAGDVILLMGSLGAGKTAFTQGIGAGLGVAATINSPTFTLVKEYMGRLPLYHFDLYRIDEPDELYALGFEEYFGGDGVAVVEWAERGEGERGEGERGTIWPPTWLRIELSASVAHPNGRMLDLTASGERGQALQAAFLAAIEASRRGGASDEPRDDEPRGVGAATEGA